MMLVRAGAFIESETLDTGNAIRNNIRKAGTRIEGLLSDAGEFTVFTESDVREAGI